MGSTTSFIQDATEGLGVADWWDGICRLLRPASWPCSELTITIEGLLGLPRMQLPRKKTQPRKTTQLRATHQRMQDQPARILTRKHLQP